MATAKLNGVEIYYQERGSGFPVIMTHGLGDSADLWSPLAEALADSYRVVSWDMRGHARSEAPMGLDAYTQDLVVEDLRALSDHLGIERAVYGGHSLGGYTALRFYEAYSERVAALVLHAAGAGYRNDEASQAWRDGLANSASRQEERFGPDARVTAKELRVGVPQLRESTQHIVRGITGFERGVLAHPRSIDAKAIQVPTLAIVGENDAEAYHASADYFEAKIPKVTKVVVTNAGHPAVLEQREVVNAAVREFLDGLKL